MKHKLVVISLLCVLLLGGLAPSLTSRASAASPAAPVASVTHTHAALFDKTRFLLHAGLAFGAFHHWVWKPYKAGQLGLSHKGNTIKAGLALLFTYHELKTALDIANKSNSATLKLIVSPLNKLTSTAESLGNSLKKGNYNPTDVANFGKTADALGTVASKGGLKIVDIVPKSIPGM